MSFKDFVYMVFALTVSGVIAIVSGVLMLEQVRYTEWLSFASGISEQIGWVFGLAAFYYTFKFLKNDVLGFKFVSEKPRQS